MFLLACLFGVNVLAFSLYTMCLGNSVINSVFVKKKISLSGLSLLAFSVLSKFKIDSCYPGVQLRTMLKFLFWVFFDVSVWFIIL